MKYEMIPAISIYELEEALQKQYGFDFIDNNGGLRQLLFGDYYMNDCYKGLDLEYEDWEDDEYVGFPIKTIKTFLQDIFPNHEYVLINVSW